MIAEDRYLKKNNAKELKLSELSSEERNRRWNEARESIIRNYSYKMDPDDVEVINHLEAELADKIKKLADLDELESSANANVQHLRSEIERKKQVLEEKNSKLEGAVAVREAQMNSMREEMMKRAAQMKSMRADHDHPKVIIKKNNAKDLKLSELSSEERERRWNEARESIIRNYSYKMDPDDVELIDHLEAELAVKIKELADLDELESLAIANVQHLRSEIEHKKKVLEEKNAKLEDAVKPAYLSEQQLKKIEMRWKAAQMKLMRADHDRPKANIRKVDKSFDAMHKASEDAQLDLESEEINPQLKTILMLVMKAKNVANLDELRFVVERSNQIMKEMDPVLVESAARIAHLKAELASEVRKLKLMSSADPKVSTVEI